MGVNYRDVDRNTNLLNRLMFKRKIVSVYGTLKSRRMPRKGSAEGVTIKHASICNKTTRVGWVAWLVTRSHIKADNDMPPVSHVGLLQYPVTKCTGVMHVRRDAMNALSVRVYI